MKAKAKIRNDRLLVSVKLSADEEIGERELDFLSKKTVLGLLKATKKRSRLIEYSGPRAVSLQERLKKTVTMREFFLIMAQICGMAQKVKNNGLFEKNLLLDMRYVFISEKTSELHFMYLPVVSNFTTPDYLGFMSEIVYSAKNDENQSGDYISKFSFFLRGLDAFSAEKIEAYISSMDRDAVNQVRNKSPRESGFITNKHNEYYEHYAEEEYEQQTYRLDRPVQEALPDYEMETGLLEGEEENWELDEATCLLSQGKSAESQEDSGNTYCMKLMRVLNNEIVSIDKPVFRIGKEKSYVDYFVSDNSAVSRSHADLIIRGSRCFVKDLNSKNRSYINDEPLPPNIETEIFDGDILRLANEEFVFKR